jgi:cystathionine beta-lyase/cystathionine gamma-synthase
MDDLHPETRVLHVGEGADVHAVPLTRPVYATSTFVFESAAEVEAYQSGTSEKYLYSRYTNPTVRAVEEKLAVLEAAETAMVTSSGMAAIATALFGLLKAGDELVCGAAMYGGTVHLITDYLQRFGVSARFLSVNDLNGVEACITPKTKLVWFESPINPSLRCVDIAAVARQCRARGVTTVLDSTFATPINQQPIRLGVDLVMHSATKYLNGHSDVIAGALAGSRELIDALESARKLFGGVLDPSAAYALGRGLKTLGVRLARQNDTAMKVAEWCERDRRITRTYYPGLPSHPDHAIARKQMSGFGGMLTIDVGGSGTSASRTFDALKLIRRAASLGGVESICSMPVLTSQYGFSDDQLAAAGVTRGMLRISIGLEHPDDLIADLDQALSY